MSDHRWRACSSSPRWSLALALAYRPLGDYMYRVVHLDPAHPRSSGASTGWSGSTPTASSRGASTRAACWRSRAVSVLFLYAFQRLQDHLWLSLGLPAGEPPTRRGTPRSASSPTPTGSRTRASPRWATWCRWPGSRCRTSSRPRSASRSRSRWSAASPAAKTDRLGNFWVDLVRIVLRILLPIAVVGAIVLRRRRRGAEPLRRHRRAPPWPAATQHITGGPVASQEVIKELGTNGGGFYNANSAHPFENPTAWTNWLEIFLLLLIPFACRARSAGWSATTGRATRSSR